MIEKPSVSVAIPVYSEEAVGRIYEEVKARPHYVVRKVVAQRASRAESAS